MVRFVFMLLVAMAGLPVLSSCQAPRKAPVCPDWDTVHRMWEVKNHPQFSSIPASFTEMPEDQPAVIHKRPPYMAH